MPIIMHERVIKIKWQILYDIKGIKYLPNNYCNNYNIKIIIIDWGRWMKYTADTTLFMYVYLIPNFEYNSRLGWVRLGSKQNIQ